MGADHQVAGASGNCGEQTQALSGSGTAGEQSHLHARAAQAAGDELRMLLGEDGGRRQQGRLALLGDRRQDGEQRQRGLAAADIALQQPQHAPLAFHIGLDFSQRVQLCLGQGEGQGRHRFRLQPAATMDGAAFVRPHPFTDQDQRQLVGEQLVIGQALACARHG